MNFFTSFLKFIDIFGCRNELKMNGKSRYKTFYGGCLTLTLIVLISFLFYYFSSDMINHKNPNSYTSETFEQNPESIKFSKESQFFMFGIEDPISYQHFYDPKIYTAQLNQEKVNASGVFKNSIPLEPCTMEHLPSDPLLLNYFTTAHKSKLENLICVKKERFEEMEIKGSFDNTDYINIKIYIYPCQNSSKNNFSCQSSEVVASKLNGFFAFYSVDYIINPGDYDNPAKTHGKDYFGFIRPGTTLMSNRYIATTEIHTNAGWLINNLDVKIYPKLAHEKESIKIGDNSTLVTYCIRKYHSKFVYERHFKKIQGVLAEIGGIINIFLFFFGVLSYPFTFRSYQTKLANEIFNFEGGNEKKIKKKYLRFQTNKSQLNTILTGDSVKDGVKSESNIIKSKTQISDGKETRIRKNNIHFFLKLKKYRLEISCWRYFKSFFRKDEELDIKIKQKNRAIDLIKNKLNINYILKKFMELDKLKMLFLDNDQINLFDYLPKPIILQNRKINALSCPFRLTNSKDFNEYIEEEDVIESSKRLFNSFHIISKKNVMTHIDHKLISFLDKDIKNILIEQETMLAPLPAINNWNEFENYSERKENFDKKIQKYKK